MKNYKVKIICMQYIMTIYRPLKIESSYINHIQYHEIWYLIQNRISIKMVFHSISWDMDYNLIWFFIQFHGIWYLNKYGISFKMVLDLI